MNSKALITSLVIFIGTYTSAINGLYKVYLMFTTGYTHYLLLEAFICFFATKMATMWVESMRENIQLFESIYLDKESKK
jgi:hypothetical protein